MRNYQISEDFSLYFVQYYERKLLNKEEIDHAVDLTPHVTVKAEISLKT